MVHIFLISMKIHIQYRQQMYLIYSRRLLSIMLRSDNIYIVLQFPSLRVPKWKCRTFLLHICSTADWRKGGSTAAAGPSPFVLHLLIQILWKQTQHVVKESPVSEIWEVVDASATFKSDVCESFGFLMSRTEKRWLTAGKQNADTAGVASF